MLSRRTYVLSKLQKSQAVRPCDDLLNIYYRLLYWEALAL